MKKLSIITINFNNCDGLRKTLESVAAQTTREFEYIVIDGGSTDGSVEVIKDFSSIIDFGISEKDSGIYNAMNKGAKHAHGEYLLFLNSGDTLFDDSVISNVLPKLVNYDIISGCTLDYTENKSYLKVPPEQVSLYTFIGGSLPHPSSFIKRSIFEAIGGYHEEYRIISDWCFFIEAVIINNCSYTTISDVIAKFNCFGISSTSASMEEPKTLEFLKNKFGRIVDDYLHIQDESISNSMYWISSQNGIKGKILRLPFKMLNSILRLRNKLGKRIKAIRID